MVSFYNRVTQHRDPRSVPIKKDKNDINSLEKKISFLTDDVASISARVISLADITEYLLTAHQREKLLTFDIMRKDCHKMSHITFLHHYDV